MADGTGLCDFRDTFPDRFFDVGISEEHAVTFAAGLSANGYRPCVAVYSTFLQRAYDNIIHDVALQDLDCVFCIDRAGLNARDGATHHGIFDVSFLNTIPDLKIYSPCCYRSLEADINSAFYADEYSSVVRYPRGVPGENVEKLSYDCIEYSHYGNLKSENVIVTYGRITSHAIDAVDGLKEIGINAFYNGGNGDAGPDVTSITIHSSVEIIFYKKITSFSCIIE
jgi:1-deoxy-D-xylulose-5-phosphate synthase